MLSRGVSFASDTRRGFSGEVSAGISVMKINRNDKRTDTTLRELLATASDLAFEYSSDTRDAYDFTRWAFVRILKDASPGSKSIDRYFSAGKYVH